MVQHFGFLVHINGKIGFISRQIHLFSLFEVPFILKLPGLAHLYLGVLTLWQVPRDDLLCLLPFVCTHIHLKSLNVFISINVVLLGLVVLAHFCVMARNFLVVRPCLVDRLVLD